MTIAVLKAQRDDRANDTLGLMCAMSLLTEKGSMDPWLERMYSPYEREQNDRRREIEQERMKEEMMIAHLRAMARKFEVKEVRNGRTG